MINVENEKLQSLKEEQLKEKMEIMEKHLPQDSALRDFIHEVSQEEAKELEEFKRE
jgi:Tfp pilus assembly protein PilO